MDRYELLDSGDQRKLEKFGPFILSRPCSQALWKPVLQASEWAKADASFSRDGGNKWSYKSKLPPSWVSSIQGLKFKISPTDFGHLGVFPEHSTLWEGMQGALSGRKEPRVLNLFAYSGGATLAAARAGAKVCHVDASKGMVAWARENAELNRFSDLPIRWIVDDVFKFLEREARRGSRYEGIILDPPSFGRGAKGEVFKIEQDIHFLLDLCVQLLSEEARFLLLTTHTPGMTPLVMEQLLGQKLSQKKGSLDAGEMLLPAARHLQLPCGSFARWTA
jgi:23S rRNA (cytosine1962-C5)-methyltransferase